MKDQAKTKAQLIRELEELRDEYEQAEELITHRERIGALAKIARGIVHDINNALTPIIGAADFMVSHPYILDDREQTLSLLRAIHGAASDTKQLVNRLRAFYKPTDVSEIRNVHADRLIEGVVQLIEPRRIQVEENAGAPVRFEMELDRACPPVRASEAQLREMLVELVVNALSALKQGGTIRIRTRAEDPGLHITIQDDGVGMSPEMLAHCYEPFVSSKSENGSGIGLARAYFVVSSCDGRIDISSTENKGTTVHISLPASPDADVLPNRPATERGGEPLDVLLIEGDDEQREVLMAHLRAEGHIVEFARDAKTALQTLSVCRFDAVLQGDRVPGMRSDVLVSSLRSVVPDTVILFLAGHETSTNEIPSAAGDGVDAVVSRFATSVELNDAIRRAVDQRAAERTA